ncbi:Na+/H+ antiporter subunit A [Paenibacillus yanchengensis]|uniref:Na+/H+ antiporter subunit A n=1 Tax=Paenibacillus yanchengensis TaxID=2035833 RepID=A0ABW4YGC8_9BACL
MSLLHATVLTPFFFACFVPVLFKKVRSIHTGWFVLLVPLLLFSYFFTYFIANYFPQNSAMTPMLFSIPWIPSLGMHFTVYVDGLSLLFLLIITGIGLLVVLYSIYYMSKEREALHNFYIYLLMFMGAMLGVVLSDNVLVLYLFWELTSVSSFLLIAYWYQRKNSRHGAQKAMLITMFGGFAMLIGFLMLGQMADTLSIREMITSLDSMTDHALFFPAMLLILLGAFTKSAQFPFHIWLPDAMEAPTPISSYLHSATMVKAGIYLIARFTPIFGGQMEWFWIIVTVGVVTLFWGSFMAVRQVDLKALLAYSTVSQLGLIVTLLGIGSLALNDQISTNTTIQGIFAGAMLAAIFHLVNHSIFKGSLFMVVGILDHETGTRDVRRLGGLMSIMPISFTLAMIGGLSMAGLPPFSGFLSKEMFFTGVLSVARHMPAWTVILPIVAWLASIFTFVYCCKLVFRTFTGEHRPELLDRKPHEAPLGMLIPPAILACLVILLFFFPNVLSQKVLQPALLAILPDLTMQTVPTQISAWHGFNLELLMTILVVIIGSWLFIQFKRWADIYDNLPRKYTLNNMYDRSLHSLEKMAAKLTGSYMTGSLTHYLMYIFSFLIIVVGGSLLLQGAFVIDWSYTSPIMPHEYILGLLIVALSIYVIFVNSRIQSIVTVGGIGYLVSLFFVIFRAPDLALTQLVVETITTSLFLLCFYFLPKLKKELKPLKLNIAHLLISIGVGATLTLVGLSAMGHKLFPSISSYFEDADTLAGALNMVNALLVDFRAFDTMLEIVVLFIAGIGVYTLVKHRKSRRR